MIVGFYQQQQTRCSLDRVKREIAVSVVVGEQVQGNVRMPFDRTVPLSMSDAIPMCCGSSHSCGPWLFKRIDRSRWDSPFQYVC